MSLDDLSLGASASPVGGSTEVSFVQSGDTEVSYVQGAGDGCREMPCATSHARASCSPVKNFKCDLGYNSYSNELIKRDTGHVGLVNQAMTCYLNSLLQTLYMTPEFRNALYRWEFDRKEDTTKSIPFQLQKLFLMLQTSKRHAVETTELTRSFGWDSSEAWQQHDVQELCRVMFDALELKFQGTDQSNLINQLYQGKLKDYVKCLECGYESAREDTYLDIPLPVRPFGETQAYGSVEEALRAFVQPEVLNESNQYLCERCNKKCDAHKGLKFIQFPYLLTLQLKRFDFDYNTMHRIKLNDKVTFPEILNLNSFIKGYNEIETNDDSSTTDSGSALDEDLVGNVAPPPAPGPAPPPPPPNLPNPPYDPDVPPSSYPSSFTPAKPNIGKLGGSGGSSDIQDDQDEGIDLGCNNASVHNSQEVSINEKNLKHSSVADKVEGPFTYELFSIMVHSGSANGGHYYAYIKSFEDGQWYCFNDQSVTRITYDDIRKTYGGGPTRGYYSGAYSSSTNAYMLMYRQIDKERNAEAMRVDDFPIHIKSLLDGMQEQEEKERQAREIERSMCKIKLFCQHPVHNRMVDMILKIHKDCPLVEATQTAYTLLKLEGVIPTDRCRLVKYDELHDSLECSFEDSDDVAIGELLGGAKSAYKFDLLMEIRPPDKPFQVYTPGGATVKVYRASIEREEVDEPITVRGCLQQTVEEFQQQVLEALGVTSTTDRQVRMVLVKYSNDLRLLTNSGRSLKAEGFYRSNKVFIECDDAEDAKKPFEDSKFCQILDRFEHTISLNVVLPIVNPDILERLGIPLHGVDPTSSTPMESAVKPQWRDGATADTSSTAAGGASADGSGGSGAGGSGDASPAAANSSSYSTGEDDSPTAPPSALPSAAIYDVDDEGLGDSECDNGPGCHGNGSGVHSDQSEDSSLTDSDRTLIGEDSPPLNRVYYNASYDNSTRDNLGRLGQSSEKETTTSSSTVWDDTNDTTEAEDEVFYFKAYPCNEGENRSLQVLVDKRITLGAFKKELEPYVGVAINYFKVFRLYGNNQEFECSRLNENLVSFSDDTKVIVRLGRVLRSGEYNVKIYQLLINEPEPAKFLLDWIFCKGMTVLDAKKQILPDLQAKCGLEVTLERLRMRKKSWRTPGPILLDYRRFDDDIPMFANWEAFVEILPGPEPLSHPNQMAIFVRRWKPSTYQLEPFQEILVDSPAIDDLKQKLSSISEIPPEKIDFAKGQGTFPCEMSLLTVHKELEWNPQVTSLNTSPLYICDDGHVIYFKDSREQLKVLSEEERREITSKEHTKLHKIGRGGYSPRKERALKIYTDSSPLPASSSASTSMALVPVTASSTTTTAAVVEADVD